MSCVTYHMSCVTFYVSPVTCQLSNVTFQVSSIMCHLSCVTCHGSQVTCNLSSTPRVTATDPTTVNLSSICIVGWFTKTVLQNPRNFTLKKIGKTKEEKVLSFAILAIHAVVFVSACERW